MPLPQHGTTLTIGGTQVVDMIDITFPGFSRESVETHSLDSTTKTFRPSRVGDWGEIEFSIMYNSGSHSSLVTLTSATSNTGFVVANGGTTLLSCSGHVTAFDWDEVNRDDEDNIMASLTAKVSGPVTF